MKPILFDKTETAFQSNGLGRLDPISCYVTEERNGQYELEMVVDVDDHHYQDIEEGRLLFVRHDDTPDKQPFEIYYISRPLNGQVTVLAHHISYRTSSITVMPFEASSITAAMVALKTNSVADNPFTLSTTKVVSGHYEVSQPSTLRSLLAGESGSLLDVYGTGEYEWDKFNIRLHTARGRETTVTLRYGKDITDLKKTTDTSSIWTGVVPFWLGTDPEDSDQQTLVILPERVIYASIADAYAYRMVVPLDMSSFFQNEPTVAELRTAAQSYVSNNEITGIPTSIDVSFVNAAQLEEYREVAALQQLRLCDTLSIVHSKLGIAAKAKIVKTVFDVLREQYSSMTLGDVRPDLATALSSGLKATIDDLKKKTASKSDLATGLTGLRTSLEQEMEDAITEQTEKIMGGAGGYIVIHTDANGKPREIFAMNTDNVNTATQVLRINMNGIGFSSTGINGPYRSAWTLDGKFVADFIQTGTLTATLIRAGLLSDVNGQNSWNLETGEFRLAATTTVGGSTVASIAENKASAATTALDNALNQQAIFNKLTNNGQTQGIYLKNGRLYINATYIDTGTLNANLIMAGGIAGTKIESGGITTDKLAANAVTTAKLAATAVTAEKIAASAVTADKIAAQAVNASKIYGGTLTLGGQSNTNGVLRINDGSGNQIGYWSNGGIQISKGNIDFDRNSTIVTYLTSDKRGYIKFGGNLDSGDWDYTSGLRMKNDSASVELSNRTASDIVSGDSYTIPSLVMKCSPGYSTDGGEAVLEANSISIKTERAISLTPDGEFYAAGGNITCEGTANFNVDCFGDGLVGGQGPKITWGGDMRISGGLSVSGSKNRVVSTDQYSDRLLYCYEIPSPMFGDIGEGTIAEDGQCFIWLDPVFAETISSAQYQVFLQAYGPGQLYVADRRPGYFIVRGEAGLSFSWELKAKQKGFEQKRLDPPDFGTGLESRDYGREALKYLAKLRDGRTP